MSEWYYAINRREMGPVSELELRELASAGALRPSDLVWKEGSPEWVQAGSCAELFPDGYPSPARARPSDDYDRPGRADHDDEAYDRRRLGDDEGYNDDWRRRRPIRQPSNSGWIVGLCVVGALLIAMVVGVVSYFVVANGPGNGPGARGGKVWEDRLTIFDDVDPTKDPTRQGCTCKKYTYQMTAGTTYQIDLESVEFDAYLRLEDPTGREVANDDDTGGGLNGQDSRIVYLATQTGLHTIYVSVFDPDPKYSQHGDYTLRVSP